ncbi:MAG: YitT family protein [Bacilli bacterium]|nr:YitT family protein [Bacilli bacterium]MBP3920387.1 YitT family protein [Bacilli bacterium]
MSNVIKEIYKKDRLIRFTVFLLGIFLVSIAYNIFILPNDIVYGVGGLGVIFYRTMGIDPSLIIMIGSILLLILSYFLLGWEQTRNSILGSLLYPLFVKITSPLATYIDLGTTETIVTVICGSVLSGFGLGLVFKSGFTTGGTDILNQIVAKYFKVSIGKSMIFSDGLIILSSLFVFGFQKFIYSIINMYIVGIMTDKVILGISESKSFYIITEHETNIKKYIMDNLSHGVTILEGRGGYTGNRIKVIMCIIPTKEYFKAKEGIKTIDPHALMLVTDAYEVSGIK